MSRSRAPPEPPSADARRGAIRAVFRAALEGADAYRAVRRGLRLDEEILRVGNRFVPIDRFGEIAFVALGNAAGSMALAAQGMLGERLTQGYLASPLPAPTALQFRHAELPDAWPGSPAAEAARVEAEELIRGLSPRDLLLLLLSPGALSVAAGPPAGLEGRAWRELLRDASAAGLDASSIARIARRYGTGGTAGAWGRLAREATVATLLVSDGTDPVLLGGGPTLPYRPEEDRLLREALETHPSVRESLVHLPSPERSGTIGPRGVHRPVVVASPADAIEPAGNLLAGQEWVSRLISLHLTGDVEAVAEAFDARLAALSGDAPMDAPLPREEPESRASAPASAEASSARPGNGTVQLPPEAIGLAAFAGATLAPIEGGDDTEALRAFLSAAERRLARRNVELAILRTAGDAPHRTGPSGQFLTVRGEETGEIRSMPVRAGVTDVGCVLLGLVPRSPTTGRGAARRR
jgi:glycerate-2-kinase